MPRRQFIADLQKAVEGTSVAGISSVRQGDDDGEFTFQCVADGESLRISALIPDLGDYPSSHTFMIFAPDDAPALVAAALSDLSAAGRSVIQLLELVSRELQSIDQDGDLQMADSQEYDVDEDEEDEEDEYFPDDDMAPRPYVDVQAASTSIEGYTKPTSAFRNRIRTDLLVAKANGFKVGHLGGLMDGLGCYVTLSCRISKLGISEEAMQAWQVEPTEYLIAIFHYPNGYKSMVAMKSYDGPTARRNFGVRVGISTTYKPTMQEAVRAFAVLNKEDEKRREESQVDSTVRKGFRNSFISRPLNELLEERFQSLLHYRYNGMPWSGAEEFYNDHIAINHTHADLGLQDKYMDPEHVSTAYPSIVTSDHIRESPHQEHSLPLVGMQFVLRHFVRCTEFCLICFTKMPDDLQAIKPYVCDKPLCLYQYMSLGFGPSIEHEILSQPKVVDLLVSFCYTTARTGTLKDFPSGLSLMVPPSAAYGKDYTTQTSHYNSWGNRQPVVTRPTTSAAEVTEGQAIRYNSATREMLFDNKDEKCPFRAGEWVVIRTNESTCSPFHCRVTDTSLYPSVRVGEPIQPATLDISTSTQQYGAPAPVQNAVPPVSASNAKPTNEFRPATFFIYDQNFDDLHDFYKIEAIHTMLDILPSVADMQQYLIRKAQSPLSSWVDRLPPAALGILRWIIASNRACIMQVDDADESNPGRKGEDRLYGMPGWSQYRFAMGAPDKERKFIQAVRETTERLKLKHATLFAWHGSPLSNWHSIIREGLHFNHTAHGRAYGHGVYHSLDINTSMVSETQSIS